jgi:hypothetical protein
VDVGGFGEMLGVLSLGGVSTGATFRRCQTVTLTASRTTAAAGSQAHCRTQPREGVATISSRVRASSDCRSRYVCSQWKQRAHSK